MNAKELLMDFFETAGMIIISVAVFYFVVVQNYFGLAQRMVIFATVLSAFSLPLMIVYRLNQKKIFFYHKKNILDKIITRPTMGDVYNDRFVIFFILFLLTLLPAFYNSYEGEDLIQTFFVFVFLSLWHLYYFRQHLGYGEDLVITYKEVFIDNIVIYLVPTLTLLLTLLGRFDSIDIYQSLLVFLIMKGWRKFFYYRKRSIL